MTATTDLLHYDQQTYREHVSSLSEVFGRRFHRVLHLHFFMHALFAVMGVAEVIALVAFFPLLMRSSIVAIGLAILFLTAFSYFVVRLYLQAKKPEQLLDLRDEYLQGCRELIGYQEGIPEHHLTLAGAATKLASTLKDDEYHLYLPPRWLDVFRPALEKLSCWCHWEDVLVMRELFLDYAIDEQIKVVKIEPTNLEVHAALANAYVMLSGLYVDPSTVEGEELDRWLPPGRYSPEMQDQFRLTAERAIEEFRILNTFAPDDPWVHAQLAYSYRDLQMPEEEIREYETIIRLRPDDHDTLFKLGIRYFQTGQTAKGLQIYEKLRGLHYAKADDILTFYGSL